MWRRPTPKLRRRGTPEEQRRRKVAHIVNQPPGQSPPRTYFAPGLIFKRMQNHYEKQISSDSTYLHALFGLLLVWSITIRCIISYLCHLLILRRMKRHCEKKICNDGAYFNAFFGRLTPWSSTIRCTRSCVVPPQQGEVGRRGQEEKRSREYVLEGAHLTH